jgi:hypothetical protein
MIPKGIPILFHLERKRQSTDHEKVTHHEKVTTDHGKVRTDHRGLIQVLLSRRNIILIITFTILIENVCGVKKK